MVLFLHGAGERGSDNVAQLTYLPEWLATAENRQKYPCFLLAPQCPAGQKWADADWSSPESTPLKDITPAMQAAVGMLDDLIKKQPVDHESRFI